MKCCNKKTNNNVHVYIYVNLYNKQIDGNVNVQYNVENKTITINVSFIFTNNCLIANKYNNL